MATERSTKQQVQAYRYGVRRVVHAVSTGSATPPGTDTARPGLFLVIGAVIAGVVVAGFLVYGFINPKPSIGSASVLIDGDGGGTYVMRDEVAHPAMNLASAMLAAGGSTDTGDGTTPEVRTVTTETLAEVPKGQLLGIPGAPASLPTDEEMVADTWQVCDVVRADPAAAPGTPGLRTTTVVVGENGTRPSPESTAFLVRSDGVRGDWLVVDGRRSVLDTSDSALMAGLGLDPTRERTVSLALLNAIPEGSPLTRPSIPAAGSAVSFGDTDFTVGEVLRVTSATGDADFQLVLQDGIQQVGPVVADVIQATSGQGEEPRTVTPASISAAPVAPEPQDFSAWPRVAPDLAAADAPGLCADWRFVDGDAVVRVDPVAAVPLPAGATPVPAPPGADRDARASLGLADAVYLAPGRGFVAALTSSGSATDSGSLVLVTDQGIAYPVVSRAALTALGLSRVQPASADLVSLLPQGPVLDPAAARQYYTATDGG